VRASFGTALLAGLVALGGAACRGQPARGPSADPWSEARGFLASGRYDETIAAVGSASDAEALFLLGQAWAGKARSAPVPTPAPGSSLPAAALLKPEEVQALDYLQRAAALRPDLAGAHLAIADLLAPRALALAARPGAAAGLPADLSVERVLKAYADAVAADPAATNAVEALIAFATGAGRVPEADAAFEELSRRRREDPDVLVRHGDFLAGRGADPERALARYAQALIWRPDDTTTRLKMAAIHLDAVGALLAGRQYARAEARLREARKYAVEPASPEAARLRQLEGRLRDIRGR
jgi:tetratricopeptide (TPR) repeat protein